MEQKIPKSILGKSDISLTEIGGYIFQKFLLTKKVKILITFFLGRKRVFSHFSRDVDMISFTIFYVKF